MMTNNNTDSDPDLYFPSSSSISTPYFHQNNPCKKRTKLIKVDLSLVPSSSSATKSSVSRRNVVPKPNYSGKKPDPSAPKITMPCSECGKKFWSWKALFGHMRCHPERQWRGINPPPNYRRPVSPIQQLSSAEAIMTVEDHEVAACLLLLSNSDGSTTTETDHCVIDDGGGGGFECSSCKKVFGSHQALGGHRASHKNVKGCFAITKSDGSCEVVDDQCESGDVLGHKCSICLRVFPSGQALGGHKRCHWEKVEEAPSSMNQEEEEEEEEEKGLIALAAKQGYGGDGLDLNLPPASVEEYSLGVTLDLRLGL